MTTNPSQSDSPQDAELIREMLEALRACIDYIPGSEVRGWPPGHALKRKALTLAQAAIAKATGSQP